MPHTTPPAPTQPRWYDYLSWGELPICDPVYGVIGPSEQPETPAAPRHDPLPGLLSRIRALIAPRPRLS